MTNKLGTRSDEGVFRELSAQECYRLLGSATVGRVAFVGSTGQQLLPINFQYADEVIYFQTSRESVLAEMALGLDDVAFSVDCRDELLQKGWSVVISGSTSLVDDEALADEIRAVARLRPWAPGDRTLVIALTPHIISGRRVSKR